MPNMQKIQNFTGQARQGWEKVSPAMGFGMRSHNNMPDGMNGPHSMKPPMPPPNATRPGSPTIAPNAPINLAFNVPFASHLGGPEPEEVIYASPGAFNRWTHPQDSPEDTPNHRLPVHTQHLENLRAQCKDFSERGGGHVQASVVSSQPKVVPGHQRGPLKALVTNVCLAGEYQLVKNLRGKILTDTPISLRTAMVDVERDLVYDTASNSIKTHFLKVLDDIANITKADLFLLHPRAVDDSSSFNGPIEVLDQRLRVAIYGDMESLEHAKMRVLIMIDQMLGRLVDSMQLELTMHTLICGRGRKNIKLVESLTNTAIYFPPPFPRIYRYSPPGSQQRPDDEIVITGQSRENILQAKKRLHDIVVSTNVYVKEAKLTPSKVDNLLLERLDKIQKIIETNGSYLVMPHLGIQQEKIRVQGLDVLHVERTLRDIEVLAGQFYSASWLISQPDPHQRQPTANDVRSMLSDICINSGAEISFENSNFHITGSDDGVKAAMLIMNEIPFVNKSQYMIQVRMELANEHKEFVSGKKNGKINKIMGQSVVQILFHQSNEYNFYITVQGNQYSNVKDGLDSVESELPASISFHVPDQYHKRIIGIGGQHIQRIMKKYSVFVKFSNAMDRGGAMNKEEEDVKVDNVICRTPSRNAHSLDLVKQEIMEMVEKADAEVVTERVPINRLFHRELIARMPEIEELEKKWNCKITFPSTEQASDLITVSGPEWQVPRAMEEFLAMVPESHEISFPSSEKIAQYLKSEEFGTEVLQKLKEHYSVEVTVSPPEKGSPRSEESVVQKQVLKLNYTRNNAGSIKDAIDALVARLVAHGLDETNVQGVIHRPKSDSFEDSLPYFESKLLQRAPTTDSPTRSQFGDDTPGERVSFMDRLRKPGSMSSFASFLDRRKNGSNSPGSLFKLASSNASKASLASLESQGSYRNPWNDSGINLNDEDPHAVASAQIPTSSAPWNPHGNALASSSSSLMRIDVPTSSGSSLSLTAAAAAAAASSSSSSNKFPFGAPTSGNASTSSLVGLGATIPGDATPKYDHSRASFDSGRPSTSHSASGYPGPIGPPR